MSSAAMMSSPSRKWFGRVRLGWKDMLTGQEGIYEEEPTGFSVWAYDDGRPGCDWFMWTEGNYECDGNRARFFLGIKDPPDEFYSGPKRLVVTKWEYMKHGTEEWIHDPEQMEETDE